MPNRGPQAEREEHQRGDRARRAQRKRCAEAAAERHHRHVRQQHAEGGSSHHLPQRVEAGGQQHGRDLGLVADLGGKNATTVAAKTLPPGSAASSSSESGLSVHSAMPMKLAATTQRNTVGVSQCATSVPSQPASAWLSRVATRMPATIGHGRRKRAASSSEQLRLVADFGERDGACGNEEGLHGRTPGPGVAGAKDSRIAPGPGARVAFGLAPPRCGVARHGDMPVDGRAKHVDARAAGAEAGGGLLPEEGRAF